LDKKMNLPDWDQRHLYPASDLAPTPLLVQIAGSLKPARVLDLACGTGRNALWLAAHGWSVTAVDGSPVAIEILRRAAMKLGVSVDAHVADLEKHEYVIEPSSWELIAICCYLQRDLFEPVKRGLVPGGLVIAMVLLSEPGHEDSPFRLRSGELRRYFEGWETLHDREGGDASHHSVAEIVARRPGV
jgi:SAM-dependent methyltransferase